MDSDGSAGLALGRSQESCVWYWYSAWLSAVKKPILNWGPGSQRTTVPTKQLIHPSLNPERVRAWPLLGKDGLAWNFGDRKAL